MEKIILIGAGGHAKSVMDSICTEEFELCGFIDEMNTGERMGKPILGANIADIPHYKTYKYFIAIGDVAARKRWYDTLNAHNLEIINIIDKTAIVSPSASIGKGNFIGKYAVINADAKINNNNIINTRATIEHECIVGSHTHLSTNTVINGKVIVDDCVFLGSCAVCIDKIHLGEGSVIGAGSVVIRDVPNHTTVVGVPAKVIKSL